MKKVLISGVVLGALVFSGCSSRYIELSKAEIVDIDLMETMIQEKPKCEYERVAIITIDKWKNQKIAINEAREEAAKRGASHFSIDFINVHSDGDVNVVGMGYRCKNFDSEAIRASREAEATK